MRTAFAFVSGFAAALIAHAIAPDQWIWVFGLYLLGIAEAAIYEQVLRR